MGKLILEEKLTLDEKLTLEEKISLSEAVEDFSSAKYPIIFKYMDDGKWEEAFEEAKKNSVEKQNVLIDNKKKLSSNQKSKIKEIAEEEGFVVYFSSDDTTITLVAENADTVDNISDLLNYFDGKDYRSGKLKKVEPLIDKNSTIEYNDDSGVDVAESVIDEYINRNNITSLDDSGKEIFKQICMQLGLSTYDNPFLEFISSSKGILYNQNHLSALNNLFSDYTIVDDDLLGDTPLSGLLSNHGLYKNNNNAKDIVELVKTFKSESEDNQKKFFDERTEEVKNWTDIKRELGSKSKSVSANERNNNVYTLPKNFNMEDVLKFLEKMTPQEKNTFKAAYR